MKSKISRTLSLLTGICVLAAALSGCGPEPKPPASLPAQSGAASSSAGAQPAGSGEEESGALYISLNGKDYTRYDFEGENTPEGLLEGIEELTGWKLSLSDGITDGKGGMTVAFSKDACLFTGPPEVQKDEFHVYDVTQFTFSVLDSVQRTLQCWASPLRPDSVDIYFCMETDQPLELEGLGVTWPLEQPYSHAGLEELLEQPG